MKKYKNILLESKNGFENVSNIKFRSPFKAQDYKQKRVILYRILNNTSPNNNWCSAMEIKTKIDGALVGENKYKWILNQF